MFWRRLAVIGVMSVIFGWGLRAVAGDLKLTLPKRSHLTPVQRLNRDGVEAVRKHSYEKAEILFYKAYLLDPDDPFTLNNLGYVSELQGQVDRAQRFYALAAKQPTDAVIDRASSKQIEGHGMTEALAGPGTPLQININSDNVTALRLLSQGRGFEADVLLQQTLKTDPRNVFTLNNLGVAKEMEGEYEEALQYFDAAAGTHSDATAVVTLHRSWRGRQATEMAAQNASKLRNLLDTQQNHEVRLAELNFRGVAAVNRNDLQTADHDFRSAYALDPNNAFALNNIGYLSEIEGDPETAQFFYDKARAVAGANSTVGLATRRSAEGRKLFQVASDSDSKVEAKVDKERESLRRQHEPVVLWHRDNTPVSEPALPEQNRRQ
ncbi:MAG: tetratricopeptide repeat protein [Terriglobales bacterium]